MINVKRRKGESFESFFRRFSRRVQQSGTILQVRKTRFHEDKPSKNTMKRSALRRMKTAAKRQYLIRIGQIEERPRGRRRRR